MNARPDPRSLALILIANAFLYGCMTTESGRNDPSLSSVPNDLFEQHEVVTGFLDHQTVLPGFFLGGPMADLAVACVDEDGDPFLTIHSYVQGTWTPQVEAKLDRDVLFVTTGRITDRDRVITCTGDSIHWFDPESSTRKPLLKFPPTYTVGDTLSIPHIDVTRDLNGDGRDDLLLPTPDGFWISIQSRDGTFADAMKLRPAGPGTNEPHLDDSQTRTDMRMPTHLIPSHLSRVHHIDHNLDGRADLAIWTGDRLVVHLQDEQGLFPPAPTISIRAAPFETGGAYSHILGQEDEGSPLFSLRKRTLRIAPHSIRDLNGDQTGDLIIHLAEGRSLIRLKTRLHIFFGKPTADGVRFAAMPDASITADGRQPIDYAIQRLVDLDGDGRLEVILINVDAGIADMFQALGASSIDLDIAIHHMNDRHIYPVEPDAELRIKPDSHFPDRRGPFFPTILFADIDGDGLMELLSTQSWDKLLVYPGKAGPDLLMDTPATVEFPQTSNEQDYIVFDINSDGKDDLIVRHRPTSEPGRVTVLLAR